MNPEEFARRLALIRSKKGVSAREMSLSLGQAPSYVNKIENRLNYPSMASFFIICEFLDITPKEFFDTKECTPYVINELVETVSDYSDEQIESLIALLKSLK